MEYLNINMIKKLIFPSLCALTFIACQNEIKKESEKKAPITITENFWKDTPPFNADSAYNYVKKQLSFGFRNPGSKGHAQCISWLKNKFEKNGWKVTLQNFSATTFDNKQWTGTNIIASFNPEAKKRILLCAHYDTRPFSDRDEDKNKKHPVPGANDGASGVAVLTAISDAIQLNTKINLGIDIIFFDLEDYGNPGGESESWCLGSQYWSKNPHTTAYQADGGILLDMVGDTNAVFPKEGVSINYNPVLVHEIWNIAQKAGYGKYFIDQSINEITDDHVFVNIYAKIPCIDIIHYYPSKSDFFEYHHRIKDDIQNISKQTLTAVGQTLLYYLYKQGEKNK